MKYERTVKAALAAAGNMKGLAEALALDIPPSRSGHNSDVTDALKEAAEAIIDAGGDPKAVDTLAKYRLTARWVAGATGDSAQGVNPLSQFAWVEGYSLTSHDEARRAGMTIAEFTANPKTSRETRVDNGKTLPGAGAVEAVVKGWTTEEKQAAARTLAQDEDAQGAIIETISDDHGLTAQVDDAWDRKNPRKQPVKNPGAVVSLMEIDVHTGLCDELVKEGKGIPSALLGIAGAVEPGTPIHNVLTLYRSALQRAQKTINDLEPLVAAMLGDGPKTAEQALAEWSNS